MDYGSFVPLDQRLALAGGKILSGPVRGAVLSADLAGSTGTIDHLVETLGPAGGVEAFGRLLNALFGRMVERVHDHRGTVTSFGGDAITCFFPEPGELSALQCALAIRQDLERTDGTGVKLAVCAGPARRFVVGDPAIQRMDVLAGSIMSRLHAAEHRARPGTVLIDRAVHQAAPERVRVGRWSTDPAWGDFGEVEELLVPVLPRPWTAGMPPGAGRERWVHPHVEQRLASLGGLFFNEFRCPAMVFLRFGGIDFDGDPAAEQRLDEMTRWVQGVFESLEGLMLQIVMGDKGNYLYGAFGTLRAHEDDASRAVEAARQLLSPPPALSFLTGLAVGASRGPVYAGAYGAESRRTFGVLGRAVHVAARLMESASPGECLVTEAVRDEAGRSFGFQEHGTLALRGLAHTVPAFRLTGRQATPAGPSPRGAVLHRMVGREAESAFLQERLDALARGEGGCVQLEGDAGIGKSRLVAHLWEAARARGLRVLAASGDALAQATPYAAWRPVLLDLLGRGEGARTVPDLLAEAGLDPALAPLLNALSPVHLAETEPTHAMLPEVRAANTRTLALRLLARDLERGGLPGQLLVVEDAHWLDAASWALLHDFRRVFPAALVVVTTRPPEAEVAAECRKLADAPGASRRVLSRLDAPATEALACDILGAETLSGDLRTLLMDRSEGNPFLAQEILQDLKETGRVRIEGGVARVSISREMAAVVDLPRSVQDVICSRVDRLSPDLQAILKIGCVVGRVFPASVLGDILGPLTDAAHLAAGLQDLARLEILVAQPGPGDEARFAFNHAITQETVYATLLESQRSSLHRSVAEWWEARCGADLEPHLGMLARHWERAGEPGRAVGYLARAGASALANFANDAAAVQYARALALLDSGAAAVSPAERGRWEIGLGEALKALLRSEEAVDHLQRGLALLGRTFPQGAFRQTLGVLGQLGIQGLHRLFPGRVGRATPEERERLLEVARALDLLTEPLFLTGHPTGLYYAVFTMLNLAERGGPSPILARSYVNMGTGLGLEGLHGAAHRYLDRAYAALAGVEDPATRCYVDLMAGVYEAGVGDWDVAVRHLREGLGLAGRMGDARRSADLLSALVPSLILTGRLEEARAEADGAVALSRDSAYPRNLCEAIFLRATLHLAGGRAEAAAEDLRTFQETLQANPGTADAMLDAMLAALRAEVAWRAGDVPLARQRIGEAIEASSRKGFVFISSLWAFSLPGDLLFEMARAGVEADPRLLARACDAMARFAKNLPVARPALLRLQAKRLLLAGRRRRAVAVLARSASEARALGMPLQEGLACVAAGQALPSGDPRGAEWRRRAAGLLGRPGCAHLGTLLGPSGTEAGNAG